MRRPVRQGFAYMSDVSVAIAIPRDDPPAARLPALPLWKTLAVVVPIPLLLGCYLCIRMPPGRVILGLAAWSAAVLGAVRWSRAMFAGRRDLVAALLIGGGATVGMALIWNEAYFDFVKLLDRQKEVFRPNMQRYFAPFYGRLRPATVLACLPLATLLIGLVVALSKWRIERPLRWWGLPVLMLAQVMLIAALAATDLGFDDGSQRIRGDSRGHRLFREDAAIFQSASELFAAYIPSMHRLNWFSQHYPPGPQLIFVLERLHNLRPLGGWVTPIGLVLATPFIYLAAAAITTRPLARNATVLAFGLASGGLLYSLMSVTPLVMLPGAIAAWAFLRGMRGWLAVVPMGVVLGAAMMAFTLLSFSSAFFGLVIGLLWLACVHWRLAPFPRLLMIAAIAAMTAFGATYALRHYAGFDLITCSFAAVDFHHAQTGTNGFDTFGEWFMRSTGNALAFMLANLPLVGLAVASLLAWPRRERPPRIATFIMPATVLAIAISAVSGKFFLETERIWTLFIPWLALGAGIELAREDNPTDVRTVAVLMLVFVAVQEVLFAHAIM